LHRFLLILNLINMSFDCKSLLINYCLSLFDFSHVVFHLVIEIILEELKEIVLYIHLFNLAINLSQFIINLRCFHLPQAFQLLSHFFNLTFLLIQTILLALLLDLSQNLRLNQV
jgi:hypothetical protein